MTSLYHTHRDVSHMSSDVTASVTHCDAEVKPASSPALSQEHVCTYDAVVTHNKSFVHRCVYQLIIEPKWRHDLKRQVARLSLYHVILSHAQIQH